MYECPIEHRIAIDRKDLEKLRNELNILTLNENSKLVEFLIFINDLLDRGNKEDKGDKQDKDHVSVLYNNRYKKMYPASI